MSETLNHERIRALTYEYTFRLDRGDFAGVAELLADGRLRMDAKGMNGEPMHGAAAIETFYAGQVVTYDGDPRTRHLITNHVVEVDAAERTATGECYFTVLQAVPRQPAGIVVVGRYHDRFERVDEVWRFTEKVIQVDYLGAIGEHFTIDHEHAARP
jgi:ketosteroid isomerase-like protein